MAPVGFTHPTTPSRPFGTDSEDGLGTEMMVKGKDAAAGGGAS